jgi:signal transduction histidine kinase
MAQHKAISLSFEAAPNLPPVLADSRQMERVLINLVSNALKYTQPSGAIHVSVSHEANTVIVAVRDNGMGISAEHLPHIFERFYRSEAAIRTTEGTGLGLAIVKEIVEKHSGTVEVESTPGEGSIFRVLLPVTQQTL